MLIAQALVSNVPVLLDTMMVFRDAFMRGILSAVSVLAQAVPELLTTLSGILSQELPMVVLYLSYELTEQLPMLLDTVLSLLNAVIFGVIDALPTVLDVLPDLLKVVGALLLKELPVLVGYIAALLPELVSQIADLLLTALPFSALAAGEEPGAEPPEPTQAAETPVTTEPEDPTDPEPTEPEPGSEVHEIYISGSSDGLFYPTNPVTRAELAVMLNRLMKPEAGESIFPDVPAGSWYADAVNALTAAGIFSGYTNGTFGPTDTVTRAVLAQTLYKVSGLEAEDLTPDFDDVAPTNWAYKAIALAQTMGWMVGDGTGSFHPDRTLTRAEAVTAINKCFSRTLDKEVLAAHPEAAFFPDVPVGQWYYSQVMEAAVAHTGVMLEGAETCWKDFEQTKTVLAPGFHVCIGNLYLVKEDQTFWITEGAGTWNETVFTCAGLSGVLTLTDFSGFFPVQEGVQVLILWGVPAPEGPVEYGGALYYVQADRSVLRSGYWQKLYFGIDGKYTTGYTDIDKFIDNVVAQATTSDMTQQQKLRACYDYIYNRVVYQANSFLAIGADCEKWMPEYMRHYMSRGKGNCYSYAAYMTYVARRLGYGTAKAHSGGIFSPGYKHGWCEITLDGVAYVCDPEINRTRFSDQPGVLFLVTYANAPAKYYPPK